MNILCSLRANYLLLLSSLLLLPYFDFCLFHVCAL